MKTLHGGFFISRFFTVFCKHFVRAETFFYDGLRKQFVKHQISFYSCLSTQCSSILFCFHSVALVELKKMNTRIVFLCFDKKQFINQNFLFFRFCFVNHRLISVFSIHGTQLVVCVIWSVALWQFMMAWFNWNIFHVNFYKSLLTLIQIAIASVVVVASIMVTKWKKRIELERILGIKKEEGWVN